MGSRATDLIFKQHRQWHSKSEWHSWVWVVFWITNKCSKHTEYINGSGLRAFLLKSTYLFEDILKNRHKHRQICVYTPQPNDLLLMACRQNCVMPHRCIFSLAVGSTNGRSYPAALIIVYYGKLSLFTHWLEILWSDHNPHDITRVVLIHVPS